MQHGAVKKAEKKKKKIFWGGDVYTRPSNFSDNSLIHFVTSNKKHLDCLLAKYTFHCGTAAV